MNEIHPNLEKTISSVLSGILINLWSEFFLYFLLIRLPDFFIYNKNKNWNQGTVDIPNHSKYFKGTISWISSDEPLWKVG